MLKHNLLLFFFAVLYNVVNVFTILSIVACSFENLTYEYNDEFNS